MATYRAQKFQDVPSIAVLEGWQLIVTAPNGYREHYSCPASHPLEAANFGNLYRSKGWTVTSSQVWVVECGAQRDAWLLG